jgi:hypothetical protein
MVLTEAGVSNGGRGKWNMSKINTSIQLPLELHQELKMLACRRSIAEERPIFLSSIVVDILRRHLLKAEK